MSTTRARLTGLEARQAGHSPLVAPPGIGMGHRGPGDAGSLTPSVRSGQQLEQHRIDTPDALTISMPATEPDPEQAQNTGMPQDTVNIL